MNKSLLLILFMLGGLTSIHNTYGQQNYLEYHREVIKCEQLIVDRQYKEAIANFELLFERFDFVFLREIKVVAQLCAFEMELDSGMKYLRMGISNGWTLKSIKKEISTYQDAVGWKKLQSEYKTLHQTYLDGLNISLKEEVHEMYKKDQKKALGALFKIGQKAQDKYAEKKFAAHSEIQFEKLHTIFDEYGYPGEKIIGNNWWVSVILSHHNSISEEYNSKDTLYASIKPKLRRALENGEVSPYTLATIEDWRTAALSGHSKTTYGFLGEIANPTLLQTVNTNRTAMGIRSIELRNALLGIEKETEMDLFLLKDWKKGEIKVVNP